MIQKEEEMKKCDSNNLFGSSNKNSNNFSLNYINQNSQEVHTNNEQRQQDLKLEETEEDKEFLEYLIEEENEILLKIQEEERKSNEIRDEIQNMINFIDAYKSNNIN